jgi:hypothetical protein
VLFHARRHPATLGEEHIAAFLNHLATEGAVSASTQNQALNALLFLYRQILKRDIGLVPGLTPAKRGRPGILTEETGALSSVLEFLLQRYLTNVAADKHFSDATSSQW